ncbi:MAG: shikimate dehydrogenase family protein [Pseudomonadota bacterium]
MNDASIPGGLPLPLRGTTRVFAILGDPIAQVGSPRVFNTLFRERGLEAVLIPLHVPTDDLPAVLAGLCGCRNVDGVILTIPHKQAVLPLLDRLGDAATRIGAVNAIRRTAEGGFEGDNFDGAGCVLGLRADGHTVRGRRTLLVGTGGAGSAVAHAFADAGVAALTLCDVDPAKAERLAASLGRAYPHLPVEVGGNDPRGFEVVVNGTPLGMRADDPLPVDPARLAPSALVVDVILEPALSPLLRAARARGCAIQPGPRMLEGQALAIARYFGIEP